jgi:putative FmdB family regulatory protein
MPIYEYVCGACGNAHEALQKISDAPLTDCPGCGATSLKKKVSAPAFRLAGSGWYETDFKTGAKKNLANDSGSGSDSGGTSTPSSSASNTSSTTASTKNSSAD